MLIRLCIYSCLLRFCCRRLSIASVASTKFEGSAHDLLAAESPVDYSLKNFWNGSRTSELCIAFVGLNGVASSLLQMLVRTGFKHLILLDDPTIVDLSR